MWFPEIAQLQSKLLKKIAEHARKHPRHLQDVGENSNLIDTHSLNSISVDFRKSTVEPQNIEQGMSKFSGSKFLVRYSKFQIFLFGSGYPVDSGRPYTL